MYATTFGCSCIMASQTFFLVVLWASIIHACWRSTELVVEYKWLFVGQKPFGDAMQIQERTHGHKWKKTSFIFPKDLRLITNDKVKLTKTAAHWQPRIKGKWIHSLSFSDDGCPHNQTFITHTIKPHNQPTRENKLQRVACNFPADTAVYNTSCNIRIIRKGTLTKDVLLQLLLFSVESRLNAIKFVVAFPVRIPKLYSRVTSWALSSSPLTAAYLATSTLLVKLVNILAGSLARS